MIELSEFIVETIREISDAIVRGRKDAALLANNTLIAPIENWHNVRDQDKGNAGNVIGWTTLRPDSTQPIVAIEFDVAVTVMQETGANARIGIVAGLLGAGGGVNSKDADSRFSRVRFSMPVALPRP